MRLFRIIALLLVVAVVSGLALPALGASPNRRAFEGRTLRLVLKEGYEIDVIQKHKDAFEKATGAKVLLEVYDEPTARQKFVFDVVSRTGAYDITSVSFWHLPEYVRGGWLEPLNDYWQAKRDPWFDPNDVPASAIQTFTMNGKLYAMPHTIIGGMFHYRKDIFEKHNIPVPRTTDDILEAAKRLARLEPGMVVWTGRGAPSFPTLGTLLGWGWGYGAKLLDENNRPHATSPEMIRAMEDYVTLMRDYGPKDAASLGFIQAGEKIQSGQAIMMFDTTGWGGIFADPSQSKVAGRMGVALVKGPAGRYLQWLYMEGLGINRYSKNKDLAWLFLQWRMSKETTMWEMQQLGRMDVPNLSVLNSPEYKAAAQRKGITDYTNLLPKAWEVTTSEHWPFLPEFARIGDAFSAQISAAIAGRQTVREALEKAQVELDRILREAGYYK